MNLYELLEHYTNFLLKHGYCDTGVFCEEPKAIDEYFAESKINPLSEVKE